MPRRVATCHWFLGGTVSVTDARKKLPPGWEDSLELWEKWMRAGALSERTIYTRRGHVRAVAHYLQMRHPADVTTQHLIMLLSDHEWSREHRRGLRCSLIQFFDHCVNQGLMEENPAAGLPSVPMSSPKPRPAPEWMWRDTLAAAGPREQLMVRLAGEAGLRRHEIAQVRRDDVFWDGEGYSITVLGKGDKQRVVPLNDALAEQIQRGRFEWIPNGVDTGFVFPSVDRWGNVIAKHVSADRVGRLISDLMPADWSAHKLRHRYATLGFAKTHDLRAVQENLGHASVATTQRYTATSSASMRAVAEAVRTF